MRKLLERSGGPEEDRTPDLFIAKEAAVKNINHLEPCCEAKSNGKTGGECTNRAQEDTRLQAVKSWLRRLVYGRALQRAIMYERGWQEAAERHPGLYEPQLVMARAEVTRLTGLNGVEQ